MAYDTKLEQRVDTAIAAWELVVPKKRMFGGLGYFVNDNICFAIRGDELLLRVDAAQKATLLKMPGVHTAIMGKRLMKSWVQAGGEAIATDEKLAHLLELGRDYALTLPPK